MDYNRIYEELIADRLANPPQGYAEVHHIVPRCMGGTDEDQNRVELTPEDHFFAHLLLARNFGTRELWATCVLMSGGEKQYLRRHRTNYGMARRELSRVNVGHAAPNADLEVRTFYHIDGETFTGTRIEFGAHTGGISQYCINNMIRGAATHTFGWSLEPRNKAEVLAAESLRRSTAGKKLRGFVRDWTLRHFHNEKTGLSVLATQTGMRNLGYLDAAKVSALAKGDRTRSDGWSLVADNDNREMLQVAAA